MWGRIGRRAGVSGAGTSTKGAGRERGPRAALREVPMKKVLLQLDPDRHPSAFDRIVAYDAGADEVLSYGGVVATDVAPLVHGAIFTRGPAELRNTAVWVGGTDVSAAETLA